MKQNQIENALRNSFSAGVFHSIKQISGGDINHAFRLVYEENGQRNSVFIKWNTHQSNSKMLELEAIGLQELKRKSNFKVPQVHGYGTEEQFNYLIMECIEAPQLMNNAYFEHGGRTLAHMHQQVQDSFGFGEDNYIATLHQSNSYEENWSKFYAKHRLFPMYELARNSGFLLGTDELFKRVCKRINSVFPNESACLLHGDFWQGNQKQTSSNEMAIFDPAVYYGNRYMDLAMTKLFGGFPERFYDAYHEVYPIHKNSTEIMKMASLYPVLVHLNLFGAAYEGQTLALIKEFS